MPTALLLHGTNSTPTSFWLPSIGAVLEAGGYQVWAPQLPHPERPVLADSLAMVLSRPIFDESTIVIGHSSGGPLVLSILEQINTTIEQAICVAGFYQPIAPNPDAPLMLQDSYNWDRIRNNTQELIFINSDNDPWDCNEAQARPTVNALQATLIIPVGEGHMGSESFSQPYKEFPLLERLISRKFFA